MSYHIGVRPIMPLHVEANLRTQKEFDEFISQLKAQWEKYSSPIPSTVTQLDVQSPDWGR